MENSNRSDGSVRVIWEILPGEGEHVFQGISQEDFDPSLFSLCNMVKPQDFPTIPYPLLNPHNDCLDRVWTQSTIKISYQSSEWLDEHQT